MSNSVCTNPFTLQGSFFCLTVSWV